MNVTAILNGGGNEGFQRAAAVREFVFPDDHGGHSDYKTEWWYFTGNVRTVSGREFGYQFTLFRNALAADVAGQGSKWNNGQIYMAHAALSDLESGEFFHDEQFSRGALDLAGAQTGPFRIWLHQWSATGMVIPCEDCFTAELSVAAKQFRLQLQLNNTQPLVLHGRQGLSAKSPTPGNASYYYSYTRLQTNGRIFVGDTSYPVQGESWYDHEWSTSALEPHQSGWDWFSLQLSDRTEIMLFRLRHEDDPMRDYYYGSLIRAGGAVEVLNGEEIHIDPVATWQSAASGIIYPSAWNIAVPGRRLTITPKMNDQEVNGSIRYWEGAVQVTGTSTDGPLSGQGYVELTGYN